MLYNELAVCVLWTSTKGDNEQKNILLIPRVIENTFNIFALSVKCP